MSDPNISQDGFQSWRAIGRPALSGAPAQSKLTAATGWRQVVRARVFSPTSAFSASVSARSVGADSTLGSAQRLPLSCAAFTWQNTKRASYKWPRHATGRVSLSAELGGVPVFSRVNILGIQKG